MGLNILSVVGARPQFIKAAIVSRALRAADGISETLLHTGQHYDERMSASFFDELGIPEPEINLGIGSATHGAQTARMLEGIEIVLLETQFDWVVVYGDTNSTVAGSLAAAKLHVPVAHVEAGLRSFNRRMPEELNRIVTDHLSDVLFAPTPTAVAHLRREGLPDDRIELVGDVMYDAARVYAPAARDQSTLVRDLGLTERNYVVATCHRAENTDDRIRLRAIFEGLAEVAERLPVVVPLHPRTRAALDALYIDVGRSEEIDGMHLLDPIGYLDMTALVMGARLVVTDSGGLQKEAYFHGRPCVTVRDETEWVELVDAGWNTLCSPQSAAAVGSALQDALEAPLSTKSCDVFGSGDASSIIVDRLMATER